MVGSFAVFASLRETKNNLSQRRKDRKVKEGLPYNLRNHFAGDVR
jgi:hypothetical protein